MSNQFLLPGFELPATIRLFLAVMPKAATTQHIHGFAHVLRQTRSLRGTPLPADQLHISLIGLGTHIALPINFLAALNAALSRLDQPAFRVRFDHVQTFRNKSRVSGGYPIVLLGNEGVAGLDALYTSLISTLSDIGLTGWPSRITPHVTLLYDRQGIPGQAIEPIEWDVCEFVLLCRHVNQNRPYTLLKKWFLQDACPSDSFLN